MSSYQNSEEKHLVLDVHKMPKETNTFFFDLLTNDVMKHSLLSLYNTYVEKSHIKEATWKRFGPN